MFTSPEQSRVSNQLAATAVIINYGNEDTTPRLQLLAVQLRIRVRRSNILLSTDPEALPDQHPRSRSS